jgi:hypothetical protein
MTFDAVEVRTYNWDMSQVTLYLPDALEAQARKRAQESGKSLSGYLTSLLAREVAPLEWPPALLSVLDEGSGSIGIPDDPPPEDVEPLA